MKIEQNWGGTRLQDYLLYGSWEPYFAFCILSGIDANSEKKYGLCTKSLLDFTAGDGVEDEERFDGRVKLLKAASIRRLRELWLSDSHDETLHPPSFFIEWALSKRFEPEWLEWAISKNLYVSKERQSLIEMSQNKLYETDLLKIQRLAILEFFNPRRNVDAKKEEVTDWIKVRGKELNLDVSDKVAEAIFTIIKPHDHNPKIKRG